MIEVAIYQEYITDKKTGEKVEKLIDGKKVYYIRTYVKDESGRCKQITRHNKAWIGRDGYKLAQQEENRLINGVNINLSKKKMTLNALKEEYLGQLKLDNDTISWKANLLRHFCEHDKTNQVETFENVDIKTITKPYYQKWQKQMREKQYVLGKKKRYYSIKYLNNVHNEICAMLEYGILEGYLNVNFAKQCGKIGTPKEIRMSKKNKTYSVINYEEFLKLLEASKNDLKYNTYFELSFTRGPRKGEIRAFRVKDFNYKEKQLMVNHTLSNKNVLKPPKTAASKAPIDLSDDLAKKVNELINILKKNKDFNDEWFIFGGKKAISSHALDYNKNKYFKICGIEKHLRLHDFRHSCATWLYSIGIDIAVISKILRHASINETLKTYTHLFEEAYTDGLSKIDNYR